LDRVGNVSRTNRFSADVPPMFRRCSGEMLGRGGAPRQHLDARAGRARAAESRRSDGVNPGVSFWRNQASVIRAGT
jgi:hypothetical protein